MERKFEDIKQVALRGMLCFETAWDNFWLPKLQEVYRMGLEKPRRIKDKEYLRTITNKTQCLVKYSNRSTPCEGPNTPAHLKTRGSGGSDYQIVCLCLRHHVEQGSMPIAEFERKYEINLYKEALENLLKFKFSDPEKLEGIIHNITEEFMGLQNE